MMVTRTRDAKLLSIRCGIAFLVGLGMMARLLHSGTV